MMKPLKLAALKASTSPSRLDVHEELRAKLVSEALNMLASKKTQGSPRSLAALAIYAAARRLGLHLSRNEIAEVAGVSRIIMRRWRKLI